MSTTTRTSRRQIGYSNSEAPRLKGELVAEVRNHGSIVKGLERIKRSRRWLHDAQLKDPVFADCMHNAALDYDENLSDQLREDALIKAMSGWDEPVYGKDGMIGTKRKFATDLHRALLKAHDPARHDRMALAMAGKLEGQNISTSPVIQLTLKASSSPVQNQDDLSA